jgi:hypothetical protein
MRAPPRRTPGESICAHLTGTGFIKCLCYLRPLVRTFMAKCFGVFACRGRRYEIRSQTDIKSVHKRAHTAVQCGLVLQCSIPNIRYSQGI